MRELSLNILDIAENSVKAGATLVTIEVLVEGNVLTVAVTDDGCGMTPEFVRKVTDPFVTTRKTRKVGMGLPLLKMEAELAGGGLEIDSAPGKGTRVAATFAVDHIDRPPLGDLADTVAALLADSSENGGREIDFVFVYRVEKREFCFDTRELKRELEGADAGSAEVLRFVRALLSENIMEINGGTEL